VLALVALAAPRAQEPSAQPPSFRAGTSAVLLDVVVRDRKGNPVRDLQPGEVTVLEDGVARETRSFRLVGPASPPAGIERATSAPGAMPDALRYPTLVTLVFDHLPQNGRAMARRAALRFVEGERPPMQWVAVFVLEQRLRLTQPFTQDRDALRAAVERATAASAETRDRLLAGQADPEQAARSEGGALAALAADRPTVNGAGIGAAVSEARVAEVMARMARMVESADLQQRGQSTLFPLMALLKAQRMLAGRKALLFFSEGLQIPPNLEEAYRSAISEANRANVSIYTIDARGLDTSRALDQSRQMLDRSGRNSQAQLAFGSSQRPVSLDDVMNSETAEGALHADTQNAMRALAEETGGALIGNTNDLGTALVQRVHGDLESYYEVGYLPAITPPDGRFRTLEVRVARRGLTVHSRSGYFALPDTDAAPLMPYELPLLAAASADPLPAAFAYSASIFRFGQTPTGVHHTLVVEVPLEHLTFQENRKARTYTLRFTAMALVKDDAGQVVQRFSEIFPLEGPIDRLPALKRGRLRFKRQFEVSPGHYTLSTIARDQATERSSVKSLSLEVPPRTSGVRISDVSIIRSIDGAGESSAAVEDPFVTGAMRVVPNLDLPVSKAANNQISAYVTIYPDGTTTRPQLAFEFIRDGTVVGRSAAELPEPDDTGRIKFVASFPTSTFAPGTYRLRAVVAQGAANATSATSFVLIP
jgi:VWFA-related protein